VRPGAAGGRASEKASPSVISSFQCIVFEINNIFKIILIFAEN
jgi:hypothetical protein